MTARPITHILFTTVPAWGHTRQFCILAARLVKKDSNVVVTMLLSPHLLDKAEAEVMVELGQSLTDGISTRLRILATFDMDSSDPYGFVQPSIETYEPAFKTLLSSTPITCAKKKTVFLAVPAPSLIILDMFVSTQMEVTRRLVKRSVPILTWVTGHCFAFIRQIGPESLGGHGYLGAKIDSEVARNPGRSVEEVGNEIYKQGCGNLVKLPGVPEMYDHEFFPQEHLFNTPLGSIMKAAYETVGKADGLILAAPYVFEPEAIDAAREWYTSKGQDLYALGPLLPEGLDEVTVTLQGHHDADEIKTFLDDMLEREGKKSVMLISFGTLFWPKVPTYVEVLINTLIEKRFPFIMALASPLANVPEEIIAKTAASGIGIFSKWCPQQDVLAHPATGWFVTHCGHNSVMEAIGYGVPIIGWPFESDQPPAAAYMSQVLKIAFELLEVRTGENGLKPIRRTGQTPEGTVDAVRREIKKVIDACRGPQGEELRRNVEAMKEKFITSWKGGIAQRELSAFLSKYSF